VREKRRSEGKKEMMGKKERRDREKKN